MKDSVMDQPDYWRLKKVFLYSLVASVTLSAAFGMYTILVGRFGWFEGRIMMTTLTIGVASIAGLACRAYLSRSPYHPIPLLGLGLTSLAVVMFLAGIWGTFTSEPYWKAAISAAVFAIACGHLSLLSLARLAERFYGALIAAYIIILGVAAMITSMMLFEEYGEMAWRVLGVGAIADAAITVLLPIFHRLSRDELPPEPSAQPEIDYAAIDREIVGLKKRLAELEQLRRVKA
jgi:hypothetical protein